LASSSMIRIVSIGVQLRGQVLLIYHTIVPERGTTY